MDRWYGTDELRRSWYLLSIATDSRDAGQFITSCEVGEGNQDKLIETHELNAENPDQEDELLKELGTRLDERRYSDVTLVTPTRNTLAVLRTRLLECDKVKQPTLRGFRHIAVSELLRNHFTKDLPDQLLNLANMNQENSDTSSVENRSSERANSSVTRLWKTRTAIGPLVPPDALRGTPL